MLAKRLIHSFPKQKNYEYLSKAYSNNEEHSEALKYYKKFINGIKKLSDGQKSRLGCIYYALYKETHNPEFAETCFNYYKEITNRCLQYALECKWIEIDANLSVSVMDGAYMQTDARLNLSFKLVSQLHRIFRKNVQNTYILFGIKQL